MFYIFTTTHFYTFVYPAGPIQSQVAHGAPGHAEPVGEVECQAEEPNATEEPLIVLDEPIECFVEAEEEKETLMPPKTTRNKKKAVLYTHADFPELLELRSQGKSLMQIARFYGVSYSTIRNTLIELDQPTHPLTPTVEGEEPKPKPSVHFTEEDTAQWHRMWADGATYREIAAQYNTSPATVGNRVKAIEDACTSQEAQKKLNVLKLMRAGWEVSSLPEKEKRAALKDIDADIEFYLSKL